MEEGREGSFCKQQVKILALVYIIFPILLVSIPLLIIITVYFIWKKSKLVWVFLLLQPFIVISFISSIIAAKDFINREATFNHRSGLPIELSEIIDSTYRIPIYTTDAITSYDSYVDLPRNATIKLLVKVFGYQSGSFSGEWPSKTTAFNYLENNYTDRPEIRHCSYAKTLGKIIKIHRQ